MAETVGRQASRLYLYLAVAGVVLVVLATAWFGFHKTDGGNKTGVSRAAPSSRPAQFGDA